MREWKIDGFVVRDLKVRVRKLNLTAFGGETLPHQKVRMSQDLEALGSSEVSE